VAQRWQKPSCALGPCRMRKGAHGAAVRVARRRNIENPLIRRADVDAPLVDITPAPAYRLVQLFETTGISP
jgi:hypothetical protein